MASASGTGRGRNKTEWTIAKITTLTEMQTDSVNMTVVAKPLPLRRDLLPYLMSRIKLSMVSPPALGIPPSSFRISIQIAKKNCECGTDITALTLNALLTTYV